MIQRCKNCSSQFRWHNIFKSFLFGYRPIECERCKTKHYINFISRLVVSIGIPLPLLFQKYCYRYFGAYSLLIYLIWASFILCIFPYFMRYHIKVKENKA